MQDCRIETAITLLHRKAAYTMPGPGKKKTRRRCFLPCLVSFAVEKEKASLETAFPRVFFMPMIAYRINDSCTSPHWRVWLALAFSTSSSGNLYFALYWSGDSRRKPIKGRLIHGEYLTRSVG